MNTKNIKNIKKAGWEKIELRKGFYVELGRFAGAKLVWFVHASRNGENGAEIISEVFDTEAEARNWVKWAM